MFRYAESFNQPIGDWNTAALSYTWGMFYGAYDFNQPIGDWDTSQVYKNFNQPVDSWNVVRVYDMRFCSIVQKLMIM
jgi:hypothetical protein